MEAIASILSSCNVPTQDKTAFLELCQRENIYDAFSFVANYEILKDQFNALPGVKMINSTRMTNALKIYAAANRQDQAVRVAAPIHEPAPNTPLKTAAKATPAPPSASATQPEQAQAALASAPVKARRIRPIAQPQTGNEKQDEQYVSEIKALIIDRERKRWSKHDADMKALQAAHDETLRVSKDNHAKQEQARREEIERILAEKQRAYDKRYKDFHREQRLAKESHEKLSQGFETVLTGVKKTVVPSYLLSQMKLEGKKTSVQPPVFNHILNVLRNPEHKGVSKLPAATIKPAWDSLMKARN